MWLKVGITSNYAILRRGLLSSRGWTRRLITGKFRSEKTIKMLRQIPTAMCALKTQKKVPSSSHQQPLTLAMSFVNMKLIKSQDFYQSRKWSEDSPSVRGVLNFRKRDIYEIKRCFSFFLLFQRKIQHHHSVKIRNASVARERYVHTKTRPDSRHLSRRHLARVRW